MYIPTTDYECTLLMNGKMLKTERRENPLNKVEQKAIIDFFFLEHFSFNVFIKHRTRTYVNEAEILRRI